MKEKIKEILQKIEEEKNIKILFAVESGSRSWRMSSSDSDYDVRFVFVRPLREYITINPLSDVILVSFNKEGQKVQQQDCFIDVCGFDIFKFTKMLSSSNPTVIEWLQSDILYYGKKSGTFLKYAKESFKPISLYHHYLSMGKQNYLKYLKTSSSVTYKKYLYSMRGIVNAKWVAHYKTLPPISFPDTLAMIEEKVVPIYIINQLKEIIKLKQEQKENFITKNIVKIDEYIEYCLKDISDEPKEKTHNTDNELIEELRRTVING